MSEHIESGCLLQCVHFEVFAICGETIGRGTRGNKLLPKPVYLVAWGAMFLVVGVTSGAALRLYKIPIQTRTLSHRDRHDSGIGGWLILVAIGLLYTPVAIVQQIVALAPMYDLQIWKTLSNPVSEHFVFLGVPTLLFTVSVNAFLLCYSLVLLVFFFRKKKLLIPLIIGFYIVSIVSIIVDHALSALVFSSPPAAKEIGEVIGQGIRCAIWIPYFLRSRRVDATFIR